MGRFRTTEPRELLVNSGKQCPYRCLHDGTYTAVGRHLAHTPPPPSPPPPRPASTLTDLHRCRHHLASPGLLHRRLIGSRGEGEGRTDGKKKGGTPGRESCRRGIRQPPTRRVPPPLLAKGGPPPLQGEEEQEARGGERSSW